MSLTVTIVMPAYNAAALLPRTLPAAIEAAAGAVVVVDPGSTDDTAAIAERLGARVIRLDRRAGPAEARNEGVAAIDSDVALFVDSDCVAHADVVDRVRRAFDGDESLVTLTGSYDDDPSDPGFFSNYMNLRHHHTHQHAQREPATFWAGCGAVRVAAYRRVNGFDAVQFPRPMIEDIELGLRMAEHGTTRLDPDLQVKHLKAWTMRSVIVTDIVHRAIPWTRLILAGQGLPNDLNLRTSQRIAAMLAPFALLSVIALPLALWWRPIAAIAPAAAIAASVTLNASLVRFFARRRGVLFAIGGWLFHQVHLTYSAVTFAGVNLRHRLSPRGSTA